MNPASRRGCPYGLTSAPGQPANRRASLPSPGMSLWQTLVSASNQASTGTYASSKSIPAKKENDNMTSTVRLHRVPKAPPERMEADVLRVRLQRRAGRHSGRNSCRNVPFRLAGIACAVDNARRAGNSLVAGAAAPSPSFERNAPGSGRAPRFHVGPHDESGRAIPSLR